MKVAFQVIGLLTIFVIGPWPSSWPLDLLGSRVPMHFLGFGHYFHHHHFDRILQASLPSTCTNIQKRQKEGEKERDEQGGSVQILPRSSPKGRLRLLPFCKATTTGMVQELWVVIQGNSTHQYIHSSTSSKMMQWYGAQKKKLILHTNIYTMLQLKSFFIIITACAKKNITKLCTNLLTQTNSCKLSLRLELVSLCHHTSYIQGFSDLESTDRHDSKQVLIMAQD